jgi:hypothetical protein
LIACGTLCLAIAGQSWGAGGPFDGTYKGKKLLADGAAEQCPAEEDLSVTIKGTALTLTDSRFRDFNIMLAVNKDGSLDKTVIAEGSMAVIKGRITGDTLDADVQDFATEHNCKYHWHLTKQP